MLLVLVKQGDAHTLADGKTFSIWKVALTHKRFNARRPSDSPLLCRPAILAQIQKDERTAIFRAGRCRGQGKNFKRTSELPRRFPAENQGSGLRLIY
jgi:hypothetical protein